MRRAVVLAALLLPVSAMLAGCASSDETVALESLSLGTIEGTVVDAGLKPLEGASVRIDGRNDSATTDATGAFTLRLPPGEYLVLATMDGHRGGALRAAPGPGATARLAFTLSPLPTQSPDVQVFEQHGLFSCGARVIVAEEANAMNCGGNDPNQRVTVSFPVGDTYGLSGAVVEVVWEPHSEAASWMEASVGSGAGESATPLAQTSAGSPIVISIPQRVLAPALSPGGSIAVTVAPTGSLTDDEAGVDGGVVVQQPFTVYLSLFYHAAQPTGYTVTRTAP